ncbi:Bud site selection protein, Revert to axial protein 1, partial [Linderina pennispora]
SETKGGVATQAEIRRAAERLFFQFVQSGAPCELLLSAQMRDEIAVRIERERRIDPELFAPVKRHVYEVMRHESYPRFLRERIYHNTTRATAAPRIALGLALIFIALTFQFSLIFLDVTPKGWRWLPIACLWPGFVLGFAGVSRIDPVLALTGRFEPVAWRFEPVRDRHIKDSHLKKASVQLAVTGLIAVVITLVLFLVPGHHL